jgi:hypothetical protein
MNLNSGGGKAEKFHLVDECRRRGIAPIVLEGGMDWLETVPQKAASGEVDVLGMAGGRSERVLRETHGKGDRSDPDRQRHADVPLGTDEADEERNDGCSRSRHDGCERPLGGGPRECEPGGRDEDDEHDELEQDSAGVARDADERSDDDRRDQEDRTDRRQAA